MENQPFIINAGPKGTFEKSGKHFTTPEQVDKLFQKMKNENCRKITLYFHGGLVNEGTGIETARKLFPKLKMKDHYPLFLVWETGLLETIKAGIVKLSDNKLFEKLLKIVSKAMEKRLGIQVVGARGAKDYLDDKQIEAELRKTRPFDYVEKKTVYSARSAALAELPEKKFMIEGLLRKDFESLLQNDLELQTLIEKEHVDAQARGLISISSTAIALAKIGYRIIQRFLDKRDHGFFPTIVEEILRQFFLAEIGSGIWEIMKDKAGKVWDSNEGLSGTEQHAGRYLLDKLATLIDTNTGNPVSINLIGHSAGSIVICKLLKEAASAYPNLKFNHILLMAPACRTDLFVNEIIKHPERYNNLRCFTMTDENECKDTLIPYLYTRSLLYLISGVLEKQGKGFDEYILGMERYLSGKVPYDKDENLDLSREFFSSVNKRLVLSKSTEDAEVGFKTSSLKHGDFDDNELTTESIRFILNS